MPKLTTAAAQKEFAETVNRVASGKERIALTRRGKVLAALVPAEDLELLERLEDERDAKELRQAIAEGGETVSWSEAKRRLRKRAA